MLTITIDPPANYNLPRLLEDGRALWGSALQAINEVQSGPDPAVGQIDARPVVALVFVFDEGTAVNQADAQALANAHDPAQLSSEQALAQRRDTARASLQATGADGVRVLAVPELSEAVAQIIEALDLDV